MGDKPHTETQPPQAGEAAKLVTARSAQRAINFLGLEASPGRLAEATAMLESPTQVQGADFETRAELAEQAVVSASEERDFMREQVTTLRQKNGELLAEIEACRKEVAAWPEDIRKEAARTSILQAPINTGRSIPTESQGAAPVEAPGVMLTDEQVMDWWASENGLEDCDMCVLTDFAKVVRAVEGKLGIASPATESGSGA